MLNTKSIIIEDMKWPQTLKVLMKRKGITQEMLAEEMNLSQGTIGHWMTGRRTPRFKRLQELADFFHTKPEMLLHDEDSPISTTVSQFSPIPATFKSFALLKMSEISKWIENPVITEKHKTVFLPDVVGHSGTVSNKAFVMELTDESAADHVYRTKPQHAKVYGVFDLEGEPVHNEIALVETKAGKMFRVCIKDGETISFRSCDPYNPVTLEDKDVKILAVAKGFYHGV